MRYLPKGQPGAMKCLGISLWKRRTGKGFLGYAMLSAGEYRRSNGIYALTRTRLMNVYLWAFLWALANRI